VAGLRASGFRDVRLARGERGAGSDQPLARQIQPGCGIADLTGQLLVLSVLGGYGAELRQARGQPLQALLSPAY
jgi:hypothetical protein